MKYENLHYFDICRQEAGRKYQFYFDAVDIIRILQGVNRFYKNDGRNEIYIKELFEEDTPIVHALAFGRFFKEGIRLLPPHQAELARVIQQSKDGNSFVFFRKDVNGNTLKRFLERDLKFFDKLQEMTRPGNVEMTDWGIKSWIDDKNKEIFKAIFLSYKANYSERLQELFSNKIVCIEQYSLDDIQINDDELFQVLSDAFRENRPGKEDRGSNFSDVAALMFLARMVQEYNDDNSKPLPIYFDSHEYLSYLSDDIMDRYFKVYTVLGSGEEAVPAYALRKDDFFRIYALENYNRSAGTVQNDRYLDLIRCGESEEILELERTFENPVLKRAIPEVGKWFRKGNEELRGRILDYVEVDFFKTVIYTLQKSQPEVINKILQDFKREELNPESAEVIDAQNDLILEYIGSEINELLRDTVDMYNVIQSRIKTVGAVARKFKERNEVLDIFYHYSLFRFLIPKKYQTTLRHFFSEDGLLSPETANFSRLTLWNLYYRTVYYKHNRRAERGRLLDRNELYILYGSFWILSLQDKLIDFYSKPEYLEELEHPLLMIIGASIDRVIIEKPDDPDIQKYKKLYATIIRMLEGRLNEQSPTEDNYEIKVVLSYLYFHLWIQQGNDRLLSGKEYKPQKIIFSPDSANYKAVEFAREALNYFRENQSGRNNSIYLYTFNILVYYVIDTAPDEEFRKIGSLRNEFINLQGTSRDWHFRYDDTVARNFHRLAEMVESKVSKLENIERAIQVLDESITKYKALEGKDIHDVRVYLNTLANIKGGLEI